MKYEISRKSIMENGKPLYSAVAWTDVGPYAFMVAKSLNEAQAEDYCVLKDGEEIEQSSNEIDWEWDVWEFISDSPYVKPDSIKSMIHSRIKKVAESISREDICRRLKFCIDQLPEQEAEALRLSYATNFKESLVAKKMNTTTNQVGKYLRQAYSRLRSILSCNIYEFGIQEGCKKNEKLKLDIIMKLNCKEYDFTDDEKAFLEVRSSDLKPSAKRALSVNGIENFGEIITKSHDELLAMKEVGKAQATIICDYLKNEYGIDYT